MISKKAFQGCALIFTFGLSLSPVPTLEAQIHEAPYFRDLEGHVQPGTIVLLDIDDTLMVPTQMLGGDEWFCHRMRMYQKQGATQRDALERTLAEWESIRHVTRMRLVEPETAKHIRDLQDRGICILGLTMQGLGLATRTWHQLLEQGIDLTRTAPHPSDVYLKEEGHGVLYRKGILFTSGTARGEALFDLFDKIGLSPRRVIFINDKECYLHDVEKVAAARGVEFVGLWYSFPESYKAQFCPEVADYQFKHSSFHRILSDEEAIGRITASAS